MTWASEHKPDFFKLIGYFGGQLSRKSRRNQEEQSEAKYENSTLRRWQNVDADAHAHEFRILCSF